METIRSVSENIASVTEEIARAARKAGRSPAEVRLLAVTKTVDDDRIREAIAAGVDLIGENYVQEARRKIELLGRPLPWHFIGHLQTNKAKYAVRLFDLIHSVDRMELGRELDRRAAAAGTPLRILVEVNVSGEASKSGIPAVHALDLIRGLAELPGLSIRGLMTMPPWFDDPEEARPHFSTLRQLAESIRRERIEGVHMEELSMGMTNDYRIAVEEGATIVRVGRAIFGERPV
ncbi:MAG TPA: YggS family pyridoxal phosphate-dependent enzyme [Syntrophales bacterium]|nr:YggS family pyridoxal phosphate-dependent enzyme [Syntrophales bacterium]